MTSKATIKDIARLAGVSVGTVDRVLHNRGEVSEETRQKVSRIVEETQYSPNVMARVLKSRKSFHLVSLLPEPTEVNAYWLKHPEGMNKALKELDAFPIRLTRINFDLQNEKDFLQKASGIFDLRPDGVLLAPIFMSESTVFCKKLTEAGIPFVFIDGFIEDTDFLSYTGEDVYQSGKVAGHLIDMVTDENRDILVINIARHIHNVHHLKKRTEGFMVYFSESGKNRGKKLAVNVKEPTSEAVGTEMKKALRENPGIGAIFVSGSKSYLPAAYLERNNISNINLIGYDLHDNNVKYLKSGITRFLLGQRPDEQAYKGIKKLFDFLSQNKIPEKFEYLPVDIVTSQNVDFFI